MSISFFLFYWFKGFSIACWVPGALNPLWYGLYLNVLPTPPALKCSRWGCNSQRPWSCQLRNAGIPLCPRRLHWHVWDPTCHTIVSARQRTRCSHCTERYMILSIVCGHFTADTGCYIFTSSLYIGCTGSYSQLLIRARPPAGWKSTYYAYLQRGTVAKWLGHLAI